MRVSVLGGAIAALVAADLVAPGTLSPSGWTRERLGDLAAKLERLAIMSAGLVRLEEIPRIDGIVLPQVAATLA